MVIGRAVVNCLISLTVVGAAIGLGPPAGQPIQRSAGNCQWLSDRLAETRPSVVLMGNSLLKEGVDQPVFEELTGTRVEEAAPGGSASAVWYLMLKNAVATSDPKPRTVVLFFRDHFLTAPGFRTGGRYIPVVNLCATDHEPLLDELAYLAADSPQELLLKRSIGLYAVREDLKQTVEFYVRDDLVGWLTVESPAGVREAIERVFADDRMDPHLLNQAQLAAETETDEDAFDFAARIDESFLPAMIELAEEHGIELVLVRVKRRRDVVPDAEPAALRAYIEDLGRYLDRHQVPLLDFTHEPRLTEADFGLGDHLNRDSGREIFTRLLAEKLGSSISTSE